MTGKYFPASPFLQQLAGRIQLEEDLPAELDPRFQHSPADQHRVPFGGIPFSDRGSRILVFRQGPALYIRLAERWVKWVAEVGDYRHRSPIIQDFMITDANDAPLDFRLTSYPHALCLATRLGDCWLAFADEETLYFTLPAGRLGITFRVYAAHGRTDRRGGEFKGDPEHRTTHRNVAYTTNAPIVSNQIVTDTQGYQQVQLQAHGATDWAFTLNITPRLGLNRSLGQADKVLHEAEARWHQWFAAAPPVAAEYAAQYYYAWWIMGMGLVSPRFYLTREAMLPSAIHYVGVWQWDAFFHALAYRHVSPKLARNQLRVMLDHQRADGMIPDAVYDEGIVTHLTLPVDADVTKPPLLAWTALKLYASHQERDFLDELYEPLTRLNRWWFEFNDDDHDGIAQYNHPFSSGLDNSPLWDAGMPVEAPDLNTYLVMQMDALAGIAQILGLPADAAQWLTRAQELAQKIIDHFWDEAAGVFWAQIDHRPIRVLTPFNLFPLITGRMPRAICARLVAHLTNPAEFWTAYPIPTVARNDPRCDPNAMWRGPTWVNINYLFIEGLAKSGYPALAHELRAKTLALLMRHKDLYEYYNPDTGTPPPHAASVFGWSSAVLIDLALQATRANERGAA